MALYLSLSIWIFFLCVIVLGTLTLFRQLSPLSTPRPRRELAVSILKPLKGADPSLEENLRSFFSILYSAPFELLFSIESKKDPAYPIVKKLTEDFPHVRARIFISINFESEFSHYGLNPKLKNLAQSYHESLYDLILISDSNVRVPPRVLSELTHEFDSNTGLITSIVAGVDFSGLGGFLEALYLNSFYARFMALSNQYAKPCVVGKSMLFQKSTASRFGGLRTLSQFLAEDFMAGDSMGKLGLKVKTARSPVEQVLGRHSFKAFWSRHVRWGRIRKAHAPLAFALEPFTGSIVVATMGAWAMSALYSFSFFQIWVGTLGLWMLCDLIQFIRLSQLSLGKFLLFPMIWVMRESIARPLWVRIASGNEVDWRGRRLQLAPGGVLVEN